MIRRAVFSDIAALVRLGVRFVSDTDYREHIPIDEGRITAWVTDLVRGGVGSASAIFVDDREGELAGMLGLFVYPSPLTGQMEAIETFWWVEPEHRGRGSALRLIAAAERWAKEGGALTLRMIAPTEGVERLYERLRFRRVEASYVRAI